MNNIAPNFKWVANPRSNPDTSLAKKILSPEIGRAARNFHRQIPGFRMSSLVALTNLAKMFNVGGIWVKNESERLQLNAFKVLGGSFAVYSHLKKLLGKENEEFTYAELLSEETRKKLGTITFTTATDGNHGRGIAWAAHKLGHKSVIYVHAETSQPRIDAITEFGAEVVVVDGNYDDAVRKSNEDSIKNNWTIVSDTSWEGYTQIPTWIMQGYTTMLVEAQEQLAGQGITRPTHVFVQAGVGAMAAAVVGYYHALFPDNPPKCVVVEPDLADCLYKSILAKDGKPHSVTGSLSTIMAGLACGDPSPLGWEILKECTDAFMICSDYVAAKGMRIYAAPLDGDQPVVAGESGAVTLGALISILSEKGDGELRKFLGLDLNSQVLLINTEGNTDPIHYRQVVWDGASAVPAKYHTQI